MLCSEYFSESQELTVMQDYLVFNVFYLFVFCLKVKAIVIVSESYTRLKCLM